VVQKYVPCNAYEAGVNGCVDTSGYGFQRSDTMNKRTVQTGLHHESHNGYDAVVANLLDNFYILGSKIEGCTHDRAISRGTTEGEIHLHLRYALYNYNSPTLSP
jgi:hypothetical protein